MTLGESAGKTDPGRKRRRNEDTFVLEPPLFAVADGMGGAQAGEVASRLAAAAFREFHEADELAPDERVRALVQEANRRIFDRARSDAEASGMGTTVTAAILEGGQVTIGHVGDSRAYRLHDGQLEQLTEDHSLVADLMRSGRLTPEEAEAHPQRSVITRALGTDPEVDVDTMAVETSPGDVFLLCSDGLTTMVSDEDILELLARSGSLDAAAKALVKAANRGGGEDNITVVLFSVEDEDATLEETLVAADGRGADENLEDTLTGLEVPPALRATETTILAPPAEADWPVDEPVEQSPERSERPPRPRRSRWRRRLVWGALALTFILLVIAGALWGLSRAYFVGADDEGNVTVFQGLPYDLSEDVGLYRARYVSRVHVSQLSAGERAELFDHELVSYDEARDRIGGYELEAAP
jgi:serine/threonine protein phosphatase PrpC